jgi:L-ascorbate metabolism protein UlaG (beta-lactamase superfamily)
LEHSGVQEMIMDFFFTEQAPPGSFEPEGMDKLLSSINHNDLLDYYFIILI